METRYHCTLLALRLVWVDSEAPLSQAFSSQAFSRTGGGPADAPAQLALPGPSQTRSQLNWFPSPSIPVGFLVSSPESVLFFQPDPERQS